MDDVQHRLCTAQCGGDDGSAVVDEFYPEEPEAEAGQEPAPTTVTLTRPAKLTNRLGRS